MRRIVKLIEPPLLSEYKSIYPNDDWKNGFRKNAGKIPISQVVKCLKKEQKGLCVYCEIDLKDGEGVAHDDFRVEHFYPENPQDSDKRNDGINYALHWENMFGCCHGGSVKTVIEKEIRYTAPSFCCDIDKANNDWTSQILNPISDIPLNVSIFNFDEDGLISVKESDNHIFSTEKAVNSIRLLRLDSKRLNRLRKNVIDKLREDIENELEQYLDGEFEEEEALSIIMKNLAETYLLEDDKGTLEAFFSTIRWYLGSDAEVVLAEND